MKPRDDCKQQLHNLLPPDFTTPRNGRDKRAFPSPKTTRIRRPPPSTYTTARLTPQWIYPFASCIDTDLPAAPKGVQMYIVKRDSCPDYVPVPAGWKVYQQFGPGEGIEVSGRDEG